MATPPSVSALPQDLASFQSSWSSHSHPPRIPKSQNSFLETLGYSSRRLQCLGRAVDWISDGRRERKSERTRRSLLGWKRTSESIHLMWVPWRTPNEGWNRMRQFEGKEERECCVWFAESVGENESVEGNEKHIHRNRVGIKSIKYGEVLNIQRN